MSSGHLIPVFSPGPLDRALMWHHGEPITRALALSEAKRLADGLPERDHVLNLCQSRYAFIVAFLAAVIRDQKTVLPGDRTSRALTLLIDRYPGLYGLSDEALPDRRLDVRVVEPSTKSHTAAVEVPGVPSGRTVATAFTSGSTGDPVPNDKTMGILSTTGRLIGARFNLDQDPQASILATVPIQHMYGLETTLAVPLWAGASVHSGRPLYPADVVGALSQLPTPRILVTTPIHLKALLTAEANLPEVRNIISATAPLTMDNAREAERRFDTEVLEIFGFSEAGTVATRRTVEGPWWRNCDGLKIHHDGVGHFVDAPHFPSPVRMTDLINARSPEEFELQGRSLDKIKIAGKRASMNGLNAILNNIDGVIDGTFFQGDAFESDKAVRLIAFVVAPDKTREDILGELRKSIDPTFLPRQLYFVPSLPRNETGKLTRDALVRLASKMKAGK